MKEFLLKKLTVTFLFVTISLFLQSCASTSNAQKQELSVAKANFAIQNYPLAFKRLLPLAEKGNSEAQYAVGYLYYYGYGVKRDEKVAMAWIEKAAKKHDKQAVAALTALRTANNSAFYTPPE